jgi:hypothetical protein
MKDEMNETYLTRLLRIRVLVGFLGERAHFGWWPTAFYEPTSRLFLDPVFARTSRLAQYHGVLEAARQLHDEHLSGGSYHAFRLPEEVEQDLHVLVQSMYGEQLTSQTQSKEAAFDSLKHLAGTLPHASEGPTAIGKIRDLNLPNLLESMAGVYLAAFSNGFNSYPYLVS